jgi:hypothetical protein
VGGNVELFLKRKNEELFLKRKSSVTLAMKRVGCNYDEDENEAFK